MADISDVMAAMGSVIASALYPTAPAGPTSVSPVVGAPVLVQIGWPDPASVDAEMTAGKALVHLYPRPGERNTTRYEARRVEGAIQATTYTLTAAGTAITVGGAAPATYTPQNLAATINGRAYVVQATAGQTPGQIATALAAAMVSDIPSATASGATVTVPADYIISALVVGATGTTAREIGRSERQIQAMVRAPTPDLRDAVAKLADLTLRDMPRLTLADGSVAHLTYHGSPFDDFTQKQGLYRRDLIFLAEFPAVITETWAQVVVGEIDGLSAAELGAMPNVNPGFDFVDPGNIVLLNP